MKKKNRPLPRGKSAGLFSRGTKHWLNVVLITILLMFPGKVVLAQPANQYDVFDSFEQSWYCLNWGDQGSVDRYSTWHTQGSNSTKLYNTTVGSGSSVYQCDLHVPKTPGYIVMDIRNGSNVSYTFRIEYVRSDGQGIQLLYPITLTPNQTTSATFNNSSYQIRQLRLIREGYGSNNVITYVDNIRFVPAGGGVPTLWDDCENGTLPDHHSWLAGDDAAYSVGKTDSSGCYSRTIKSPNLGSTSSMIVQWDNSVNTGSTAGNILAQGFTVDLNQYLYYEFDVYGVTGTENIELRFVCSNSSGYIISDGVRIGQGNANRWQTIQIPVTGTVAQLSGINQIKFEVNGTDQVLIGRVYIDNFRLLKGVLPQGTIQTLDYAHTGLYPHVVKDYNDQKLVGNNLYGKVQNGNGNGGTFTTQIVSGGYSSYAMQGDYNVTSITSNMYYANTLKLKYDNRKIALYLKGGSNNPQRVRLEIHDINWVSSGYSSKAVCYLNGITTNWQQWIVNLDQTALTYYGNGIDPDNITEIVIGLDQVTPRTPSGTFYVDDITLLSQTNTYTLYPGIALPQSPELDLNNPGTGWYSHIMNNFNGTECLTGNSLMGTVGGGGNGYGQSIVTSTYKSAPSCIKTDYDVSSPGSYIFHYEVQKATATVPGATRKLALYLKGNPGNVVLEVKGPNSIMMGTCYLGNIPTNAFGQYVITLDATGLENFIGIPDTIREVALKVDNETATGSLSGSLYIDDITFVDQKADFDAPYFGNQASIISNWASYGTPHTLKNYDNGILNGNLFYGETQTGVGNGATLTPAITDVAHGYSSTKGLSINYDMSPYGTSPVKHDRWGFLYETLNQNSYKKYLVFYLKSETNQNPLALKFELEDKNGGKGTFYAIGISSTDWHQWIIPMDPQKITGLDTSCVSKFTISLDYYTPAAKNGKFYIDGITFVDKLNTGVRNYPGLALPQPVIVDLSTKGVKNPMMEFNKGTSHNYGLNNNNYYGKATTGASPGASIIQSFSTTAGTSNTSPSCKIDYSVAQIGSNISYTNTMDMCYSGKKYIAFYIKAASDALNPGMVQLELHDKNWLSTFKGAVCTVNGITSNFQQWIIPVDNLNFIADGSFDFNTITEVAFILRNNQARVATGSFYIDDITFVDNTPTPVYYAGFKPASDPNDLIGGNWDTPSLWSKSAATESWDTLVSFPGLKSNGIILDYHANGQWVNMYRNVSFASTYPLSFFMKANNPYDKVDIKFTDNNNIAWGRTDISLGGFYNKWNRVVIYASDMYELYSTGHTFASPIKKIEIAAKSGPWRVYFDEIGQGPAGIQSSFQPNLDPNRELAGIGFDQRRDVTMDVEDPLVITYLEQLQDASGTAHTLVTSSVGSSDAQTFNNSVVAMAFILKGQKERAERILDFYSNATDPNNTDIIKQNFYYKNGTVSEKRGFYQTVDINTYRVKDGTTSDRWMGDMAWLLLAYKFYERQYSSNKYVTITNLLRDLLRTYYIPATVGGYVKKGWTNNDAQFNSDGHHEGNIDAYAALKLCGIGSDTIQNIKNWLENELTTVRQNKDLPLDLYTWRTLAFGADDASAVSLMNIPEYDFRYRKKLHLPNPTDNVWGFYAPGPDLFVDNFWMDGFGHATCAYLSYGDRQRGYFYANQMDKVLITNVINGVTTHTIPYAANKTGDYSWVDPMNGFSSSAAWYIFAKNCFNPFSAFSIYLDVPYVQRENSNFSDAACAKMILNYEGTNSYTQTTLHNYGIGTGVNYTLGLNYFDPYGMYRSLNNKELDVDFNYSQLARTSQTDAYKDLCYWMSRDIPNVPKIHMPATVPIGGLFTDWIVVNGFQASVNPQLSSSYTVYGFYVKDPKVTGIGQDMYIQASIFGSNYFKPINVSMPGIWDNLYVTIDEPPLQSKTITVQATQPADQAPNTNEKRYMAAEQGLKKYQMMNQKNISSAMNGAVRGRIYFANNTGTTNDYFIVCFEKSGGVIAAVNIDSINGALKEVTFLQTPDAGYYTRLVALGYSRRAKSSEVQEGISNPFYPEFAESVTEAGSTPTITAINQNNVQPGTVNFELMPNPANDYVRVKYSIEKESNVNINLYDLYGQLVKTVANTTQGTGSYNVTVNLQDLKSGIYFFTFNTGTLVQTKEFIITK